MKKTLRSAPAPAHNVKFTAYRNQEGNTVRGAWVSETLSVEKAEGGWGCFVPMCRIGQSRYFEFRPEEAGGKLINIGTYRTREQCCIVAEHLKSGNGVLRDKYTTEGVSMPYIIVPWVEIKEEIERLSQSE